jgi:O-acetyl-ADP-ribose deacetylase
MKYSIGSGTLELLFGDISQQKVDAIVNAANTRLSGGSGVDGAIHKQGGPKILEDTKKRYPMGCQTGRAVISDPGNLNCRLVIHAVGPIWHKGSSHEAEMLEQAYLKSLEAAQENDCESVAFPALSCGAYAFPVDAAAEIALRTTKHWLEKVQKPSCIRFVLFSETVLEAFLKTAEKLLAGVSPQATNG